MMGTSPRDDEGQTADCFGLTDAEVAAILSDQEGRTVTVQEVRRITVQALRKLRRYMLESGLVPADLL